MATERQIEANRRNAARSTGPKTEAGKARSRANAIRHGMAGESAGVEADASPEFLERRAKWAGGRPIVDDEANWALDRAVAASLRIERCERALDHLATASVERARLAWHQDRDVEAAVTFGRLARDPVLASRQLQASLAGVDLLIEAWLGLASATESGRDWSEAEAARALDLLGVAPDLRAGRTPIDDPGADDPIAARRSLALAEVDRLESLRDDAMGPLDDVDRRLALAGDVALLSKPAKLILRYERDAWRRYREAIRLARADEPAPSPTPAPAPPPPPAPPAPSFEDQRRALQAAAAPIRQSIGDRLAALDTDEEADWLDELERRIDALPDHRLAPIGPRGPLTGRTQFGGVALDRAASRPAEG